VNLSEPPLFGSSFLWVLYGSSLLQFHFAALFMHLSIQALVKVVFIAFRLSFWIFRRYASMIVPMIRRVAPILIQSICLLPLCFSGQQTAKTVAIVLGGAVGVGFLVICLLFARSLVKKKEGELVEI
jgi:hypothetical protein